MKDTAEKKCTRCETYKNTDEFALNKSRKDGLSAWCKECNSEYALERSRTKDGLITRIYAHQRRNSKSRSHEMPSYTRDELRDWLFSQKSFHELYDKWVNSGYSKDLVPSVDRKKNSLPYTMSNIQVMTFKDNRGKYYAEVLNGEEKNRYKIVFQFSKDRVFVAKYHSENHASRILGFHQPSINHVCKGIREYAHGYIWKHEEDVVFDGTTYKLKQQ